MHKQRKVKMLDANSYIPSCHLCARRAPSSYPRLPVGLEDVTVRMTVGSRGIWVHTFKLDFRNSNVHPEAREEGNRVPWIFDRGYHTVNRRFSYPASGCFQR
jgi:hypothetical protein